MKAVLRAAGAYLPGPLIPNSALTQFPPDRLGLIEQKTGIKGRHRAALGEATSDLGLEAARRCLSNARFAPTSIDAILLATSTPDRLIPAAATRIQHGLGASNAFAMDINSVCSGSVFGLHLADCLIRGGNHHTVLLVAADCYSRFLDPHDFSTAPYFGDAGAAVLLTGEDTAEKGIAASFLHTDGSGADLIQIPAGGSRTPPGEAQNPREYRFRMDGRAVYEFAVTRGVEAISKVAKRAGLVNADIDWVIPHQANINICRELAKRSSIPEERFVLNLETCGNTAAASPLLALAGAWQKVAIAGKTACIVAFGGGLSYGSIIVRF